MNKKWEIFLSVFILWMCYLLYAKIINHPCNKISGFDTSETAQQIAQAFITNVEEIRIAKLEHDKNEEGGKVFWDPLNIFYPYAVEQVHDTGKIVAFNIPCTQFISVSVDTIRYSPDSLLCVALLIINDHYTNKYYKERKGNVYDGVAVIGYRENVNSGFQLFPMDKLVVHSFPEPREVQCILRRFYFNDIIASGGASGTNRQGLEYTCGIGDDNFFKYSPDFMLNEYLDYNFKYYLYRGITFPLNYPGNRRIEQMGENK